jgi:hypothetical protein
MKQQTLLSGSLSLMLLGVMAPSGAAQVVAPAHNSVSLPPPVEHIPSRDPVFVEKSVLTGEIASIDSVNNTVVIRDEKTGKRLAFHLDKRTRFRADKQTEFDGRKSISLADFKAGHLVRLTYRDSDGKPLELRLRSNKF